jgi:hypothetical protein
MLEADSNPWQRCTSAVMLPVQKYFDNCKPYCYKCYYRVSCRPGRRPGQNVISWRRPPTCNCRSSVEIVVRDLCRACAELDEAVVIQKQGAKPVSPSYLGDPSVACGVCGEKLLSDGPRWWYCGRCRKECTWDGHLNWVERSKRVKLSNKC